jgi:hypothetical protein
VGVLRFRFVLGAVLTAALLSPSLAAAQGDSTSTLVSCTPSSTLVGVATSCSATVLDTSSDGPSTPTGSVEFSTDTTGGVFTNPGSSCPLTGAGENGASCRATYTPGSVGTGVHKVTATFDGDTGHDGSSGFTNLPVAKHSSATSVSCAPGSITLGGGTSTCVVTVTDTSTAISTPTGGVTMSSASGAFGPGCEALALVSTSQASCTVTYTPAVSGTNTLLGQYGGDPAHQTSEGTALVGAAASSGPSSSAAAKKKCKKKPGRSASAAKKKKCKKKKRR